MQQSKALTIFAPAKLNLFLHLTGRASNNYHKIDSLVCFADIGDFVTIENAPSFSFKIKGEFAQNFKKSDKSSLLNGNNLVVKAARALSQATDKALNVKITLTKNLPLASGIGGGSSDAAATIWGLQELWGLEHDNNYINNLLSKLGSDVPVCLKCAPSIMRGTGDILTLAPIMPEVPILLINPMISCSTQDVFLEHNSKFKKDTILPKQFNSIEELTNTLKTLSNDLYEPALKYVPEIKNIINALDASPNCLLSRMSGSGASCFGIFSSIKDAEYAKQTIAKENPDWWLKSGWLNRPERY